MSPSSLKSTATFQQLPRTPTAVVRFRRFPRAPLAHTKMPIFRHFHRRKFVFVLQSMAYCVHTHKITQISNRQLLHSHTFSISKSLTSRMIRFLLVFLRRKLFAREFVGRGGGGYTRLQINFKVDSKINGVRT